MEEQQKELRREFVRMQTESLSKLKELMNTVDSDRDFALHASLTRIQRQVRDSIEYLKVRNTEI